MTSREQVMIFIDGSNLFNSAKRRDLKINYNKLCSDLLKDRDLVRKYYFSSIPKEMSESQTKCFEELKVSGFVMKLFPLKERKTSLLEKLYKMEWTREFLCQCNVKGSAELSDKLYQEYIEYSEKGVDVAMTTFFIIEGLKNNYDTAILITGDGDFKIAVEEMIAYGKTVEIASFKDSTSRDLKNCCNKFIPLDNIITRNYK